MKGRAVEIAVSGVGKVPATLRKARRDDGSLVLAPGAGGSKDGPLLSSFATGLATRGVSTVAFDFPYRAAGRRFPDPPEVREACYRAVVAWMTERAGTVPFVGGHSMGGRAASSCATLGMECAGLVLLGYPLYPAGKRGARDAWRDGQLPLAGPGARLRMLLLTGTRDDLCVLDDLRAVVAPAGARARVVEVVAADHSFEVLVRSGRTRREVLAELVDATDAWIRERPDQPVTAGKRGDRGRAP